MSEFASAPYTAGQLNAMVKKLVELAGQDGPKKLLSGELVLKAANLLHLVTTNPVPAVKRFAASDHFKVGTSKKAAVRIGYLGDNFKKHFLAKVEVNVPATTLVFSTLTRSSLDAPILAELGTQAQTTLASLWECLKAQGHGQPGTLLTDGRWNIFYISDANGNPWAVCASWHVGYGDWRVFAYSVDYPGEWDGGGRVVSRK
ncbi:MAG: hypothetical protein IT406_00215 [Candidatus Yanofskybacteria bacterium]|nr:hypothetical protein [Candidatus Yanofskybacteria bacterium]